MQQFWQNLSVISTEHFLILGVVLFAIGFWFLMPDMPVQLTQTYKQIYWPSVLVLAGLAFMIRPITKRRRH